MQPADHVTGLASRAELQTRLEHLLHDGVPCALLICDVVHLRDVNEREGFGAGDARLRLAADRLRRAARDAELVARLGGDELVAVFTGPGAGMSAGCAAAALAAPGEPALRSAAVVAAAGEQTRPLIDRAYATMRRS